MAIPAKRSRIASSSTSVIQRGNQRYTLRRITGAEATDPHAPGTLIAEGTTDKTITTDSGLRIWAGKAGDPFWIEPDVLHAVGHAFQDGTTINLGDWVPSKAKNLFAGQTVYSIVLEVPDAELLSATGDEHKIGVWAVATLATDAGGWRSINRIGLPMIHPLFTQYNEDLGNRLNAGHPSRRFCDLRRARRQIYRRRRVGNRDVRRPCKRTASGLHGASSPTCCPIKSERRRHSALLNGMGAHSPTMRRT